MSAHFIDDIECSYRLTTVVEEPIRYRTFQVYRRGRFVRLAFEALRAGDVFCAFEPDGSPVLYEGFRYFRADMDARRDGSIDMTTLYELP